MRIRDLEVVGAAPVDRFDVRDLSDLVVIAGPNGVGKTRLLKYLIAHLRGGSPSSGVRGTIEATIKAEVDAWGGLKVLDLSSDPDMGLFRQSLQSNRRRHYLRSSLVNFDSDRTVQNLPALQPSFENPDPYEEELSWETTFNPMSNRYQDTVHSMFRMMTAQGQSIANKARELKRAGKKEMKLEFEDPMAAFKRVFAQLLGPKELVDPVPSRQGLEYRENGEVREFASLSSGEREVVNIAFDFLLRDPRDCIVFFDEPELHLHPELSYRLIQTLETIGKRNQFVLSTHSPDIISASLDRSVIFLTPPSLAPDGAPRNQALPVVESDETNQALRLIGQSIGIVALGKRLVLVEGASASLDKQLYGSIIAGRYPSLVLVPSGGRHVLESFATIYNSVLSKTIWGVEFFMLCDRDSAPPSSVPQTKVADEQGRLRILSRYHLENFLLDEHVWAKAFEDLELPGSWLRSSPAIRSELRALALGLVSYATALGVTAKLRLEVGNVDTMPRDCQGKTEAEIGLLLVDRARVESARVHKVLDGVRIKREVARRFRAISKSLKDDTDDWKAMIPGKPLVSMFASKAGVQLGRAKNMYINANRNGPFDSFKEIDEIFSEFATL